eukprot:gene10746-biopygen13874
MAGWPGSTSTLQGLCSVGYLWVLAALPRMVRGCDRFQSCCIVNNALYTHLRMWPEERGFLGADRLVSMAGWPGSTSTLQGLCSVERNALLQTTTFLGNAGILRFQRILADAR